MSSHLLARSLRCQCHSSRLAAKAISTHGITRFLCSSACPNCSPGPPDRTNTFFAFCCAVVSRARPHNRNAKIISREGSKAHTLSSIAWDYSAGNGSIAGMQRRMQEKTSGRVRRRAPRSRCTRRSTRVRKWPTSSRRCSRAGPSDPSRKKMKAGILSGAGARGVFGGVSQEGSTMRSDDGANKSLYGKN